jgi:hypothetical protein
MKAPVWRKTCPNRETEALGLFERIISLVCFLIAGNYTRTFSLPPRMTSRPSRIGVCIILWYTCIFGHCSPFTHTYVKDVEAIGNGLRLLLDATAQGGPEWYNENHNISIPQ